MVVGPTTANHNVCARTAWADFLESDHAISWTTPALVHTPFRGVSAALETYHCVGRTRLCWKTAGAKANPSKMCRVLATEYVTFAANQPVDGTTEIPPDALEASARLSHWDPYLYGAAAGHMAADYQRDAFVGQHIYPVLFVQLSNQIAPSVSLCGLVSACKRHARL